MRPIGLAVLMIGIWAAYCGFYGINPIATAQKVIKDPSTAGDIIKQAKADQVKALAPIINLFSQATGVSVASGGGGSVTPGPPGAGAAAIAPDAYDPFASDPINETFAEHLARGSEGGIDITIPQGTPLPAPFTGTVHYDVDWSGSSTGGTVGTVTADSGWQSQYLEMSAIVDGLEGQRVKAGTIIGNSGGAVGVPGSGSTSTGAHLHWHLIAPDGTRTDPGVIG